MRDICAPNAPGARKLRGGAGAFTTLRPSLRPSSLLCTGFAAFGLLLVGCGAGDDQDEVAKLLDRAFDRPVESAEVNFDSTIRVRGLPRLTRPIRVRASGPYRAPRGAPPEFDMDLRVGVEGGGASVDTGRLAVGDRAFVKFQGSFYELPRKQVEESKEAFEGQRTRRSRPGGLGLRPRAWVRSAEDEGEEEIEGMRTRHVSGQLDVRRVLDDLNRFVVRAGKSLGAGAASAAPRPLSPPVLDKVARVVRNPTFDVYVGAGDGRIRRLSANVQFDVPEADRRQVGGIEGGSLELTLELRDVGGDRRIVAPARSRPLADLTRQLGGAGVLDLQGFGAPGGQGAQAPETPRRRQAPRPQPQGGGGNDAGAFQRYSDCLDKADPQDTAALQRCSQLLNR